MAKNNAKLPDYSTLIQAGINPSTGLPVKMGDPGDGRIKTDLKRVLRVLDEQEAINRYKWYNLPGDLTSQLVERILYYKGQAMFFYIEEVDKFYFLPYALDGTIDVYGRFLRVKPLPFGGTATTDTQNKDGKTALHQWLSLYTRNVIREVIDDDEDLDIEDLFKNSCVLLHDYSKQRSETIIPRQELQDPILDLMAEVFPLARTNLIANSGIKGLRVQNQDYYSNVLAMNSTIKRASLNGEIFVPVVAEVEMQELTEKGSIRGEEFLEYLQSLDNLRLSFYGLSNGGLFQKKAHMLQTEADINTGNTELAFQDGLTLRQNFCNIVNSIWDLDIWVEASEVTQDVDMNGDGEMSDEIDQEGEYNELPGGGVHEE